MRVAEYAKASDIKTLDALMTAPYREGHRLRGSSTSARWSQRRGAPLRFTESFELRRFRFSDDSSFQRKAYSSQFEALLSDAVVPFRRLITM